ncbi:MAG: RNA polymerase sigma factor [Rhodobacteraceae bacterium]|nr:RNA polymerase sigma factor [Paracoccaceae bacterium]
MPFLDEVEAAIPALRRYAHALLRDRSAADDLVQDCLERALSRRILWRRQGDVKPWLFRILLNLCRDEHRRRAARPVLVPIDSVSEAGGSGGQEEFMNLREVHRAMGQLPEDQRAALLLVSLEGMSLGEAAQVLGIPDGTLASRLARARAALRRTTCRAPDRPDDVRGHRP